MRMRELVLGSFAIAASLGFAAGATAQVYPSRPMTMVVPFPAGGPTDIIARIVAERMRASLGQPVTIENVVGASGNIGTGRLARATGDGYTFGIGNLPTHALNGAAYALPYDLLRDFEPVSLITSDPLWIIANKTVPANDLKELIAWLKGNPDKASQGTSGAGSAAHVAGTLFQKETGTSYQFVFYRGSSLAIQDLVAGQIHLMIDTSANALPQVQAGSVNAYAVTAKSRAPVAPKIPTADEAGLPGFYITNWHGLWAPKGTPKNVIAKLNVATVEALADPAVRQRLADLGQEIVPRAQQTPEALGAFQKSEIEKWWPIIKAAGIKAE
jgi:tripartite-type tricarboxylate transporter receptor subunit TctC